jgi:hypothetical protein
MSTVQFQKPWKLLRRGFKSQAVELPKENHTLTVLEQDPLLALLKNEYDRTPVIPDRTSGAFLRDCRCSSDGKPLIRGRAGR